MDDDLATYEVKQERVIRVRAVSAAAAVAAANTALVSPTLTTGWDPAIISVQTTNCGAVKERN